MCQREVDVGEGGERAAIELGAQLDHSGFQGFEPRIVRDHVLRARALLGQRMLQRLAPRDLSGLPAARALRALVAQPCLCIDEHQHVAQPGQPVLRVVLQQEGHVEDDAFATGSLQLGETLQDLGTNAGMGKAFEGGALCCGPFRIRATPAEDARRDAGAIRGSARVQVVRAEAFAHETRGLGALQDGVDERVGAQQRVWGTGQELGHARLARGDAAQDADDLRSAARGAWGAG
jgi:hypothetical protein